MFEPLIAGGIKSSFEWNENREINFVLKDTFKEWRRIQKYTRRLDNAGRSGMTKYSKICKKTGRRSTLKKPLTMSSVRTISRENIASSSRYTKTQHEFNKSTQLLEVINRPTENPSGVSVAEEWCLNIQCRGDACTFQFNPDVGRRRAVVSTVLRPLGSVLQASIHSRIHAMHSWLVLSFPCWMDPTESCEEGHLEKIRTAF